MWRIKKSHEQKPMYAFLLQEHHLTNTRAKNRNVYQKAKDQGLLYIQADMPDGDVKGGTAVIIPFNMIEKFQGESDEAARRRVESSAYRKADGRMVSATTLINGAPVTFTSIYAPVNPPDRPAFFTAIKPYLSKTHIIGMDANCVFNPRIDVSRPDGTIKAKDTAGTKELYTTLTDNDLTDIAREALGDAPSYTNVKVLAGGTTTTRKRIDHIHVPTIDSLCFTHINTPPDILPFQTYGHHMLEVDLKIIREERGRDLPFINEAIYDDPAFNEEIGAILASVGTPHPGEWGKAWESAKSKLETISLEKTKENRTAKDKEVTALKEKIKFAKKYAQGSATACNATFAAEIRALENQLHEYSKKRRSLHDMLEKEAHSNGQKHDVNTAAFHRQWTPKNSAQWVTELIRKDWTDPSNPLPPPDGQPATETHHDKIAEAFTAYYKPLYADKPPVTAGFAIDGTPINPFQVAIDTLKSGNRVQPPTAKKCGLPITPEEVEHTMAYLPKGKSPGPDRLPNQFYRVFSKPLSIILAHVYNESKEIHGHLPETLRQGNISVLYKKKDRDDPRNYRPITLLNNDYKILMRILAQRMNEAVVQFVSRDQNGFVPNGFIAENIMRLQLLQDLIEEEDQEALFIFLDMEKAFDRCSWQFLIEGLEAVGFDSTFIDYIKLAYSADHPPTRQMYVNGFLGPSFELGSGVAQGCPISPLLFLIIAEPLTRLINRDANITGIHTDPQDMVNGRPKRHKISQFADDSTLILRLLDIPHALHNIKIWCQATSMKENATKREILLLGTLRGHPERLPADLAPSIIADGKTIRALGVPMGNDFDEVHWWLERYRTVKARTTHWNGLARLSITGRNILLQSILYGSLRYWFFTMCVPDSIITMLEADAKELLWASNPDLQGDQDGTPNQSNRYIYREASWLPQKQGGGSVMHLESHIKAFQAQWIIKYLDPRDSPWKDVLDHWLDTNDRLGRGTIMTPRGLDVFERIPERCTYIRKCFESFHELDLKQDLTLLTYRSTGEPLWKNPRFTVPRMTPNGGGVHDKPAWIENLNTYRLSDLESSEGGYIDNRDLSRRIDNSTPPSNLSARQVRNWERERELEIPVIRAHVPRNIKNMMRDTEPPDIDPGDIVLITLSNPVEQLYAIYCTDENDPKQYERIWLDTSSFPQLPAMVHFGLRPRPDSAGRQRRVKSCSHGRSTARRKGQQTAPANDLFYVSRRSHWYPLCNLERRLASETFVSETGRFWPPLLLRRTLPSKKVL